MKTHNNLSAIYDDIMAGLSHRADTFVPAESTHGEVYDLAATIRSRLSLSGGKKDAVCLYTDNKTLIAAAVIAALSGGPRLILPHALSDQTLNEINQMNPFRRILTDREMDAPKGMEIINPQHGRAGHPGSPLQVCDLDEPFLMLFTGGSTGRSKMWSKTPRNILAEASYLARTFAIRKDDIFLSTVPPQHIYGFLFSILLPLISGAKVLPGTYVFPREIWSAVTRHAATVLISVPVHYRVLKMDDMGGHSLRLAFSSAGMLEEPDAVSFYQRTGLGIHEIYGSTETGGIATRCRAEGQTSWKPFENVLWKIDEERLLVRSDFISSELDKDGNGYFVTGDRASYNGHEQFILVGRVDGIVKIGGKRVDLKEIESKLKQISGVSDAIVISFPSPHGRQNDIAAVVVSTLTEVRIRRSLAAMLEPHAVPKRIKIADAIPVTAAGKYDRAAVERMFR